MRLQCKEQEQAIEREIRAYKTVSSTNVMELLDHCYVVKAGHDKMAYLLFPLMKVWHFVCVICCCVVLSSM